LVELTKGEQNRVLLKVAEQLADLLSKKADAADKNRLDSSVIAGDPASQRNDEFVSQLLDSPPAVAKQEKSQSASAGDSITIKDNRLHNPDPPILAQIPYQETPTVDELLDRIRRSLTSPPKVPDPGSYGRQWILYSNGRYFHEIGRRWAQFIEGKQLTRGL
jgi:hypothetical protein